LIKALAASNVANAGTILLFFFIFSRFYFVDSKIVATFASTQYPKGLHVTSTKMTSRWRDNFKLTFLADAAEFSAAFIVYNSYYVESITTYLLSNSWHKDNYNT